MLEPSLKLIALVKTECTLRPSWIEIEFCCWTQFSFCKQLLIRAAGKGISIKIKFCHIKPNNAIQIFLQYKLVPPMWSSGLTGRKIAILFQMDSHSPSLAEEVPSFHGGILGSLPKSNTMKWFFLKDWFHWIVI